MVIVRTTEKIFPWRQALRTHVSTSHDNFQVFIILQWAGIKQSAPFRSTTVEYAITQWQKSSVSCEIESGIALHAGVRRLGTRRHGDLVQSTDSTNECATKFVGPGGFSGEEVG